MLNVPISVHEEDLHLAGGGVMNEGPTALRLGLRGIPNAAEDVMIARDITLARLTGGRVHIAHLSTRGAVALVRQAKAEGLPVTAEATPHHFTLTEAAVEGKPGAVVTWTVIGTTLFPNTFTATTTPNSTDCFNVTFDNPTAAGAAPTAPAGSTVPAGQTGNIGTGGAGSGLQGTADLQRAASSDRLVCRA